MSNPEENSESERAKVLKQLAQQIRDLEKLQRDYKAMKKIRGDGWQIPFFENGDSKDGRRNWVSLYRTISYEEAAWIKRGGFRNLSLIDDDTGEVAATGVQVTNIPGFGGDLLCWVSVLVSVWDLFYLYELLSPYHTDVRTFLLPSDLLNDPGRCRHQMLTSAKETEAATHTRHFNEYPSGEPAYTSSLDLEGRRAQGEFLDGLRAYIELIRRMEKGK